MSLNTLQLTPFLLATLYPDTLVKLSSAPVVAAPEFSFLGNNKSHLLIIVNSEDAAYQTDEALRFLTSILNACHFSLEDVAIVNWQKQSLQGAEIIERVSVSKALLFGINPLTFGLPMNFPFFQVQEFKQITYLHAPDLPTIQQDPLLKKQLWKALKTLFKL